MDDYRSAELHAQLLQQAVACRRDTPKLACDNIVQFSSLSFDTGSAAARWSGRWYVLGDGPRARLEVSIDVEPLKPGRWRIAGDAVAVRDGAGDIRKGRVSGIRVAMNDRVGLDTPRFAGPVDGAGDAEVSLEVALPASAPDFEVVLPELLLGGERIAGPSSRFDRRTFDGGIEPFNWLKAMATTIYDRPEHVELRRQVARFLAQEVEPNALAGRPGRTR